MRLGKVTENVLKRSVWKMLHKDQKTSGATGYTDCASFVIPDKSCVLSAVCPITAKTSHAGKYAVVGAVNNLCAAGGNADQIQLSVLLPQDAEEALLRQIMTEAQEAAKAYGAVVAGGHTEVTNAVTWPLVTATAIGHRTGSTNEKKCSGASLIVTKWIGLEGTAMIAEEKADRIREKYPSFIEKNGKEFGTMKYLSIAEEAKIAMENGALCLHDISGGGIFAALWELGEMAHSGMDVYLKNIPIRQETVEITDLFDVNPYLMMSQGALLIAAEDGEKMVQALENAGIPATRIGELTDGNDRIIHNDDETRFLDLPQADEIHKILG